MGKRKIALLIAIMAIAAAATVGGTLAWFSDTETATNKFSTGEVDVAVYETGESGTPAATGGIDYGTDIVPGAKINKDPVIVNTGSNPAYIRVQVEFAVDGPEDDLNENLSFDSFLTMAGMQLGSGWSKAGNYYYWPTALASGAQTTALFTNLAAVGGDPYTIFLNPAQFGNAYRDAEFTIGIKVDAVQSENVSVPAGGLSQLTLWPE